MPENGPVDYPVKMSIPYPEQSSRGLALASIFFMLPKLLIILPHIVALYFIRIVALIAWILGQWVVLFTGKYPRSFHNFVTGALRWQTRVAGYLYGLTDKYPPFTLR